MEPVETGPVAVAIWLRAGAIRLTTVGIRSFAVAMGFSAVGFRPLAVGVGLTAVGIRSFAVAIGSPAVGVGLTAVGFRLPAVAIGLTAVGVGLGAVAFVSIAFPAFCVKSAFGMGKTPVSGIAGTRAGRARHSVRAVLPVGRASPRAGPPQSSPSHAETSPDFFAFLRFGKLLIID